MHRSQFFAAATAFVAGLWLAGCTSETTTAPPAAPSEVAVAPTANAATLSVEELRARASTNLKANQLHSPAGDNAVEAYLALRDKSATLQPDVETALVDMEPYVVIAAEQATTAAQFDEAARLIALLGRMDPAAPALGRLASALDEARAAAALAAETERLAEEERARSAQALAEQTTREQAITSPTPAATPAQAAAAPRPSAPPPAAPRPTPAAPSPSVPVAASNPATTLPAAAATPAATRALLSRVAPKFPEAALRRRLEGEVEVLARVAADGSVEQVDVLRSDPPGVFDREAVLAVRRWRYASAASASSVRVVLTFKRP